MEKAVFHFVIRLKLLTFFICMTTSLFDTIKFLYARRGTMNAWEFAHIFHTTKYTRFFHERTHYIRKKKTVKLTNHRQRHICSSISYSLYYKVTEFEFLQREKHSLTHTALLHFIFLSIILIHRIDQCSLFNVTFLRHFDRHFEVQLNV